MAGEIAAAGIATAGQIIGKIGNVKRAKKLASFQHQKNLELMKYQNEYNTPAAQMQRFKEAGLNPNLMYGQGNAGNMQSAPSYPDLVGQNPDYSSVATNAIQTYQQARMTDAKTGEAYMNIQAKQVQTEIAKTNPMLKPHVAAWVSDSMEELARLKTLESRQWMAKGRGEDTMKFQQRINSEVEAMTQRLGLNTSDLAIKNRILESKEFENAIKELQVNWLKDGDFTPEHIRQGLMLLLSKMLGK